MKPPSSRARTRRRHGGAEMPTLSARSTLVIRPSSCNSLRIRRSMRSSLTRRITFLRIRPLARNYITRAAQRQAPACLWLAIVFWADGAEEARRGSVALALSALELADDARRQTPILDHDDKDLAKRIRRAMDLLHTVPGALAAHEQQRIVANRRRGHGAVEILEARCRARAEAPVVIENQRLA